MDATLPKAWLELSNGRMVFLEGAPCTIGRSATNSVVLDQPGVSRNHAMVQDDGGGGHIVADLRSTNGTYVNGLRLEQGHTLRDGDNILIGDASLIYRCQLKTHRAPEAGQTSVQIHSGPSWLLLVDVIGFTTHTQKVGNQAAADDFKEWLERVRPVLATHGATINSYLGDAIFVYWRQDRHDPAKVASAVTELTKLQPQSRLPFRILVHQGPVRISGGMQGESLSGSDVIFLFRIEKSTKSLGSPCVLSEPAAKSLNLAAAARPLGQHSVPDFTGTHAFYGLPK
jgi:pSer/pThr/pTyr-binding forkhead associated (FHA) protein